MDTNSYMGIAKPSKPRRGTDTWHDLHITDKSGKRFFPTVASPLAVTSEIRNLQKHLNTAKAQPHLYTFLDAESAYIVLDGQPYMPSISSKEAGNILKELGL